MNPNLGRILLNDNTTTRTDLRGISGINCNDLPTSFFRFVGKHVDKNAPGGVEERVSVSFPLSSTSSQSENSIDVEIFDANNIMFRDKVLG